MKQFDGRSKDRNSFLLLAELRTSSSSDRIKIRNLSATGMMAEAERVPDLSSAVEVQIRNIGWVPGTVAWANGTRFGLRFHDAIDPALARAPVGAGEHTPRFVRPPLETEERGEIRRVI